MRMLGYLAAIGISVLYMLFLDGTLGVLLLAFLLLLPVLSVGVTIYARRVLEVSFRTQQHLQKNKPAELRIWLHKPNRMPLPFFVFLPKPDLHFAQPDGKPVSRHCAMGTTQDAEIIQTVTPQICGKAILELCSPRMQDYLGLFTLKLRKPLYVETLILPRVPEMPETTSLFRSVQNEALTSDEEDEESAAAFLHTNAIAGYEHRNYVPGDPLRRINWKLSSKRGTLMVRMDEASSIARTVVILDLTTALGTVSPLEQLQMQERVTEGALGILLLCAKQGLRCSFYYYAPDGWRERCLESAEAVEQEAAAVLEGGFAPAGTRERLPGALLGGTSACSSLIFTASPDDQLRRLLAGLPGKVHLITPDTLRYPTADGVTPWRLTPDYRLLAD